MCGRPARRNAVTSLSGDPPAAPSCSSVHGGAVPSEGMIEPWAPRIGWGDDPRTELTIAWSTDRPVANPVVDFGIDDTFGRPLPADTRTVRGWGVNSPRVPVEGLKPGKASRSPLRHAGAAGPPHTVRTAPA